VNDNPPNQEEQKSRESIPDRKDVRPNTELIAVVPAGTMADIAVTAPVGAVAALKQRLCLRPASSQEKKEVHGALRCIV